MGIQGSFLVIEILFPLGNLFNRKNVLRGGVSESMELGNSFLVKSGYLWYPRKIARKGTVIMKKNNIVLIGMPGVGKSTVGVILAKVLGYQFVDADLVIQKEEGKLLREIIAEVGTEGFIEVENRVNASLQVEQSIIATGGSVVYGKEAMEHLKSIGTVVYLQLPFDELDKRLHDIKGRGVVLKDGQTLEDLFEERRPLYEKYADVVVNEYGLNVEQTVEKILELKDEITCIE